MRQVASSTIDTNSFASTKIEVSLTQGQLRQSALTQRERLRMSSNRLFNNRLRSYMAHWGGFRLRSAARDLSQEKRRKSDTTEFVSHTSDTNSLAPALGGVE